MIVNIEDVIAYEIDNKVVCPACITKNDVVTANSIIRKDEFDYTELVFCDRCSTRIA